MDNIASELVCFCYLLTDGSELVTTFCIFHSNLYAVVMCDGLWKESSLLYTEF